MYFKTKEKTANDFMDMIWFGFNIFTRCLQLIQTKADWSKMCPLSFMSKIYHFKSREFLLAMLLFIRVNERCYIILLPFLVPDFTKNVCPT